MTKIRGLLLFSLLLSLIACGQSAKIPLKTRLSKIYSQAIADFIKDSGKRAKSNFDSLYIGKRKSGQSDDFPDIQLPKTIENTHIILISPEAGMLKQKERKSRTYINMVGWVDEEKAEFLFFVFSNGFEHQYNYSINYKYNPIRKEFDLVKLQFKGPPFDK